MVERRWKVQEDKNMRIEFHVDFIMAGVLSAAQLFFWHLRVYTFSPPLKHVYTHTVQCACPTSSHDV